MVAGALLPGHPPTRQTDPSRAPEHYRPAIIMARLRRELDAF